MTSFPAASRQNAFGSASGTPAGGPTEALRVSWLHPLGLIGLSVYNFFMRLLTLGIYHFWGKTEVRRRIWSAIRLNGEPLEYFVGKWNFKYLGRESGLWTAPRQGTVTISKKADGKSADAALQGTNDAGAYKETWMITFDEAAKMLTWVEKLSSGATITAKGDWTSPISIRFTIDPVKIKGQNLKLKRTLSVVSAHSFTVTEELSEDNGPFVRLGSAIYSREMVK